MPSHSTRPLDLSGQHFGKLTVEKQVPRPAALTKAGTYWLCRCDCGTTLVIRRDSLTGGNAQSCGCARIETLRAVRTTHGMSGSSTYIVWCGMIARCENPKEPAYSDYGGRGVTICDRWHSFEAFFEDMGERPGSLTLDRIDNAGNYAPGNCRWATRIQQARNKRSNRLLTYKGETLPLSEWAERVGVSDVTLWARLNVYKWTLERALTTKVSPINAS